MEAEFVPLDEQQVLLLFRVLDVLVTETDRCDDEDGGFDAAMAV